jgi:hypothetical protein
MQRRTVRDMNFGFLFAFSTNAFFAISTLVRGAFFHVRARLNRCFAAERHTQLA